MNAILGVGMLAATALLFALAYGQFRRPNPGAWTQSDLGGLAVILPLVVLFMFGVFHLAVFLFNLESETRWLEIAAVAGVSLLVCWLAVPRLMAPALRAARSPSALGSASADRLPAPANDPRPAAPARAKRATGRSGKRRAA
ncbi:hypothetical protein [Fodinicurvata sediminis]|uniref:hypothetical protein n=1 Tax=Fodinicurvata sediminis TaxID=1121832 RepID=UPI0003B6F748|nr:hypothetical protein [Fodinicurvata sediminis]